MTFILLTACNGGEDNNKESSEKRATEEDEAMSNIEITDAVGNKLAFDESPGSIATFDSGVLDILHVLDANIAGRPTSSGPVDEELEGVTEIGNPHEPNFEKIAEVNPDVLIVSPSFRQYEDNLKDQGIEPVYTDANSVEDILDSINLIGTLLNKEEKAEKITTSITNSVEEMEDSAGEEVNTLLVYGAPGTYLAALPNSLSGDLLEKSGGVNIAADFPEEENYPQYASFSSEKIIEANPELIMLITHGDPDGVKEAFEEEMSEDATWKNLDAVKNDQVIVLPSHLFGSNPGTKVTEALETMQGNLSEVK